MPAATRLRTDLERLRALAATTDGRILIRSAPTAALSGVQIDLRYAVPGSERYPAEIQRQTRLTVSLPARYPFQSPVASVRPAVWHPNVFPSGTICLGTRWLPTEGLDLFVQRVVRLLTFDPLLVNTASPANRAAAAWYERALRRHPGAFPSDRPAFVDPSPRGPDARVGWRDATGSGERVLRTCPSCARTLRLPRGRSGRVRCPGCRTSFEATT